jgi:hypothetical protein
LEGLVAAAWDTWQATYRKLKQESPEVIPSFRCEQLPPQAWRLTFQGVLARADWQEGHEQQVIRIALRQWPHTFRPPVRGQGRLIHLEQKPRIETSPTAVHVQNWGEGAEVIAKAFEKLLEQQTSQIVPASNSPRKDGRTLDTEQRLQRFLTDRAEKYESLVAAVLQGDASAITAFRQEFGPASFARHVAEERNLKADMQEINRIRTAVQETSTYRQRIKPVLKGLPPQDWNSGDEADAVVADVIRSMREQARGKAS